MMWRLRSIMTSGRIMKNACLTVLAGVLAVFIGAVAARRQVDQFEIAHRRLNGESVSSIARWQCHCFQSTRFVVNVVERTSTRKGNSRWLNEKYEINNFMGNLRIDKG